MKSTSGVAGLVGRAELLDDVCAGLEAGGAGAVVLGGPGVGKTAVLNAVAGRLRGNFHLVSICGSIVSSGMTYGALAYVISELPEGTEQDPVVLFNELRRRLPEAEGIRRVLVTVDNADLLDPSSVMVLSQLLRHGKIAVLATASPQWDSDDELVGLWREGLLVRVDLERLSERQTRQLMQHLLGGPVSALAAGTMWRETGGTPRLVRLMTTAQVRSGALIRRDAIWVRTLPFIRTGEVTEVVDTSLDRLPSQERRLVELLALCVSLPLTAVLDLFSAATVDSLEEHQIIDVDGDLPGVRLGSGIPGPVIAASMAPGRRRELWDKASVRIDPGKMAGAEMVAFVDWSLSCGEVPAAEDALRAARAANDLADAPAALRCVRAVPAELRSQETVIEEVRALQALGQLEEALGILKHFRGRLAPERRAGYVRLMVLWGRILARLITEDDPRRMLAAVDATRPAQGDSPEAEAALIMARSELAADGGRLGQVPDGLGNLAMKAPLSPATRMQAAALSAHVHALAGRGSEALHVLSLLGAPGNYPICAGDAGDVCTRIFDTYVLTGELDRAAKFVESFDRSGIRPSYLGSAGELAKAVLAVWQGQDGAALDALTNGIGQLRVSDPQNMLPLAGTLEAYIHRNRPAMSGDSAGPIACPEQGSPYFRHFQLRYFSVLAEDTETETRCARLREEAAAARAAGYLGPALLFLSAALRTGDRQAAAQIRATAAAVSGRFSELVADFAAGLLGADPVLLVSAAKGLSDRGQYLLSRAAAQAAEEVLAAGSPDRHKGLSRAARALANASLRRMQHVGGRAETLAGLSRFEADLAQRAVTSASTAEIGRELNLSPRTIEWHLGKIFAKLHVSGRAELAGILA